MKYVVVKEFADLLDKKHLYRVGDIFPHSGAVPSADRVSELSSSRNRIGVPLIEECVSEVKEDAQEAKTDVSPSDRTKAKRRPRKRQENHA